MNILEPEEPESYESEMLSHVVERELEEAEARFYDEEADGPELDEALEPELEEVEKHFLGPRTEEAALTEAELDRLVWAGSRELPAVETGLGATIGPDGTVVYSKGKGGKCYSPAKSGVPRCAFHRHSGGPKIPSRCVHPTFKHRLTQDEVRHMTACPFYAPSEVAAASLTTAFSGGEIDRSPMTESTPASDLSEAFKLALGYEREIKFGTVMLPQWEDDARPDLLVPKLGFSYVDNNDPIQGSLLEFVARAVKDSEIAVLIGHLGTGKTTGIMHVAERCNAPLVVLNCDGQLTVEQVLGSRVPAIDGETGRSTLVWRDSPTLEAYRLGYWAVIDDYTFTGSDVFSAIYGLMTSDRYQVHVTGEVIPKHPNFRLFLTTNPPEYIELYPNRQQPDAAFLSRIDSRFWVSFLPEKDERRVMREAAPLISDDALDRMQRVIKVSRHMLSQNDLNFVFSTRHAVKWARKVQRLGDLKRASFESFLADLDGESKHVMLSKVLDTQLEG